MKVPHQRHVIAQDGQPIANDRHSGSRLVAIHGDTNDLRPRPRQRHHLTHRGVDIGGIGIGHRLDHHRGASANQHAPDIDTNRSPAHQRPSHHNTSGFVSPQIEIAPYRRNTAAL